MSLNRQPKIFQTTIEGFDALVTKTVAAVDDFVVMIDTEARPYKITQANLFAGLSSGGGDTLPGGGGDTLPGGGATADPYYANVINLLRFNGNNGSPTFVDEKGLTIVRNGSPVIDTTISKYGGGSGRFLSANNDYLELPHVNFGTADFTIELWLYLTAPFTGTVGICGQGSLYISNFGGTLYFWLNNGFTYSFGANPIQNVWTHVAVSRSNGVLKLFLDGALKNTVADTTNLNIPGNFTIGLAGKGEYNQYLTGNIDDFRMSVGVGRYTANFNPATDTYLN